MSDHRLLTNARVLTAHGRFVPASVLAAGGRIVDVLWGAGDAGLGDRDDIDTVDLGRGWVIPGFVDAHFHLRALALKRLRCDLSPAYSPAELAEALTRHARARPDAAVVMGVDWDESDWEEPVFPTRRLLDEVDASRPVFARRVCGHAGVANTALLERLRAQGVETGTRFADEATGILTEHAVYAANRLCAPDAGDVAASFAGAIGHLHSLGVTAIHDIVTPGNFDVYARGLESAWAGGGARLRIDALVVGSFDELERVRRRAASLPDAFRIAGVKHFADGSLGAHTAALRWPYADADTRGELLLDEDALAGIYRGCAERGLVCAVHAIGDRAVAAALRARSGIDADGWLLRIEHAEVLDDELIAAVAAGGVALVVQPNFARNWGGEGGLYARRLGGQRWAMTNPLRALETAGVNLVFGSDGMPPGPLYGLGGATRHPVPGQAIAPRLALRRYTEAARRLPGHEHNGGVIEPGRTADLTVLSGDPLLADPDGIRVLATVVGGEVVYRRPAHFPSSNT